MLSLFAEFGDWSSEEISCLKDGLRKYGRAWGKIYREVGGLKTATQCKQFYDKHCGNQELDLSASLTEHSTMKASCDVSVIALFIVVLVQNAEKLRRKVENRKPVTTEGKRKSLKPANKPSPLQGAEEIDSENTASAYESDSNSEESTSESTITDSSPEDGSSSSAFMPPTQQKMSQRGKKPKSLSAGFRRTSEEALDLFISAAEALNNIIPPDVALHDHSYALPPNSLMNNVDLQATSGLSLIAAAAAVVSPTLSKNAASNKLPSLSPVRAPRGRPPNSQRKGTNGTTSKLAPTLLSPAGTSPSVLLTEMKAAPLRGRTRSAPADRPKLSTFHVPRTGSTLARMSINSNSRTVSRAGGTGLLSSYTRHKGDSSSGKTLKSMIAFHPTTSSTCSTGSTTSTNATSAFEALVNVAVAAPPAELPMSASSPHSSSYSKSSSPVATTAFTATPLTRSSQSAKDTVTIGVAGSNSNASNSGGTTTAFIDVNQAINILASLAQHQVSSSAANGSSQSIVLPNSRLFAPNQTVNLLGNIVSGGSKGVSGAGLTLPTSKGSKSLSVSATVDTLLGHLTSGIGAQPSTTKSTAGKASGGSGRLKKTASSKSEGAGVKSNSASSSRGSGTKLVTNTTLPVQLIGSMDELSNLNLLSSLVAAVAASQATATPTSSQQTTPTSEPTVASDLKTSVGQPSNLHSSSSTEIKRPLEAVSRTSSSESSSTYQSHTSTPLIAASSSIKKSSLQNSSSGGVYDGGTSNELPRSVVRTGLGTMATAEGEEGVATPGNSIPQSENDMTASLASIIPSYNPSMNSQSSLLLYTRSLSFPLSVPPEPSAEEEDHLESATRGISELSKLLGTDSNTENNSSPNTKHNRNVYKGLSNWNPADLLSNSAPSKNACGGDFAGGLADSSGKPYLSGLLESQVHGTVHHTSSKLNNSSTSSAGRVEGLETTLDMDHSR